MLQFYSPHVPVQPLAPSAGSSVPYDLLLQLQIEKQMSIQYSHQYTNLAFRTLTN